MPWYDENTFVIKTDNIEAVKEFLEDFGLAFVLEKHGDGPEHYACETEGKVLEIYPSKRKAL